MCASTTNDHKTWLDTELARELKRKMKADFEVPDDRIRLTVVDGIATLEGIVDRKCQKAAAERCAGTVEGILSIDNLIRVAEPEIPAEDW